MRRWTAPFLQILLGQLTTDAQLCARSVAGEGTGGGGSDGRPEPGAGDAAAGGHPGAVPQQPASRPPDGECCRLPLPISHCCDCSCCGGGPVRSPPQPHYCPPSVELRAAAGAHAHHKMNVGRCNREAECTDLRWWSWTRGRVLKCAACGLGGRACTMSRGGAWMRRSNGTRRQWGRCPRTRAP